MENAFRQIRKIAGKNYNNYITQQRLLGIEEITLRENLIFAFVKEKSFEIHHRELLENISDPNVLNRESYAVSLVDKHESRVTEMTDM